jgi:hypothetical protein
MTTKDKRANDQTNPINPSWVDPQLTAAKREGWGMGHEDATNQTVDLRNSDDPREVGAVVMLNDGKPEPYRKLMEEKRRLITE